VPPPPALIPQSLSLILSISLSKPRVELLFELAVEGVLAEVGVVLHQLQARRGVPPVLEWLWGWEGRISIQ